MAAENVIWKAWLQKKIQDPSQFQSRDIIDKYERVKTPHPRPRFWMNKVIIKQRRRKIYGWFVLNRITLPRKFLHVFFNGMLRNAYVSLLVINQRLQLTTCIFSWSWCKTAFFLWSTEKSTNIGPWPLLFFHWVSLPHRVRIGVD
jgi:hypothetical protein